MNICQSVFAGEALKNSNATFEVVPVVDVLVILVATKPAGPETSSLRSGVVVPIPTSPVA